jgi:hypothetical protein
VAQTFTPKVTGKLDALTLWVDSEGHYDVRVRITETSGGKPDLSRVIAESLVPQPANVPALSTLSFDDQLAMLHQGTLYAFVLSSSDPSIAFADAAFGLVQDTSAYPAGDALYFGQSGTWSSMTSEVPNVPIDFVFRTWMAPVPEPAIGSLLFIASLAICRQRRIAGIL